MKKQFLAKLVICAILVSALTATGLLSAVNAASGGDGYDTSSDVTPVEPTPAVITPVVSENGAISADVSSAVIANAIQTAESLGRGTVVLTVEPAGTETAVKEATVTISASVLDSVAKNEATTLVSIETPVADIKIPNNSLEILGSGGGSIVVSARAGDSTGAVTISIQRDGDNVAVPITAAVNLTAEDAAKPGMVAVIVNEDGTETIVKTSVNKFNTMFVPLEGGATIKLVDNTKTFVDTDGGWMDEAVTFVTSRELFQGTSTEQAVFSPNDTFTNASFVTLLARIDGQDTSTGESWDSVGIAWAEENGISTVTEPTGAISRENMAVMLYNYIGKPEVSGSIADFPDAADVSEDSLNAIIWATQSGVINGADGFLKPQSSAMRSEVSQIILNFIKATTD